MRRCAQIRTRGIQRPVAAGACRLSSSYGYRNSPFTGYSMHLGEDFAARLGTDIHAVADGTVEYEGVGKDGRSKMLVILGHEIGGEVFSSWSVHMYEDGIFVRPGQEVRAGDGDRSGGAATARGPAIRGAVDRNVAGSDIPRVCFVVTDHMAPLPTGS